MPRVILCFCIKDTVSILFDVYVNSVQGQLAVMLSLFPNPYDGVIVVDLPRSRNNKEALQLSKRTKVNGNFGAKSFGASAGTLLYSSLPFI